VQTFIARGGQQVGSYNEEELTAAFQRGELLRTDHYWREGMSEWGSVGDLLPPPAPVPTAEAARASTPPPFVPPTLRSNRPVPATPPRWIVPAAIVIACVFLVLGICGLIFFGAQKAASRDFTNELKDYSARQGQQQPVAHGGTTGGDTSQFNNEMNKLQELSKGEDATDRKMADETISMLRAVHQRRQACHDAEKSMIALGFEPSKLTSITEIDQRRQAVQDALPVLRSMVDYLTNLDKTVHDELVARGVSSAAADGYVSGMSRSGKHAAPLKYWQEEEAISQDLLANLDLLEQNEGKWRLQDGRIMFQDPITLAQYRSNQEKLRSDITAQKAAQQEMRPSGT
jgi:hypothetical protein